MLLDVTNLMVLAEPLPIMFLAVILKLVILLARLVLKVKLGALEGARSEITQFCPPSNEYSTL